ncbi:MAG TPA: acetate/propionate family kinase [Gemmatimonadales bacterium]|nr:acetate/propionate family kinase [Gemmatimonadales bacterium]
MVILVVNCGSSSLKWSLFRADGSTLTRIAGETRAVPARGYRDALLEVRRQLPTSPDLIAHRMVHGGTIDRELVLIDQAILEQLELATELAPLHNEPALQGIRLGMEIGVPQIVAFDSAFHRTMPEVAYRYAIPASIPVRRLGFHGWSHRHACEEYARLSGSSAPTIITLHLGSGCSATAIRLGESVDTSMGYSPLEGLVMGTRAGDLDPGVITYLLHQGVRMDQVDQILNRESGLVALAGTSDMRELLEREDPAARLAVDIFCYRARKYVGAYLAVLEGAEALVFTGGIGERSAEIRRRICEPLGWAGITLDPQCNERSERRISAEGSRMAAWVIPAEEEQMIARVSLRFLAALS